MTKKRCHGFPGPFGRARDMFGNVEFIDSLTGEAHYPLIIPLRIEDDGWALLNPFSIWVWIASLVCLPLYLAIVGLADYVFWGSVKWQTLIGFALRILLSEHVKKLPNDKMAYQKILLVSWIGPVFVLVTLYAGTLTAMLARPGIPAPIRNAEELLNQNDISLVVEEGSYQEYFLRRAPPGSTKRRLFEYSTKVPAAKKDSFGGCYPSEEYHNGKYAVICNEGQVMSMRRKDFGSTGLCNFYEAEDKFNAALPARFAFQVRTSVAV